MADTNATGSWCSATVCPVWKREGTLTCALKLKSLCNIHPLSPRVMRLVEGSREHLQTFTAQGRIHHLLLRPAWGTGEIKIPISTVHTSYTEVTNLVLPMWNEIPKPHFPNLKLMCLWLEKNSNAKCCPGSGKGALLALVAPATPHLDVQDQGICRNSGFRPAGLQRGDFSTVLVCLSLPGLPPHPQLPCG